MKIEREMRAKLNEMRGLRDDLDAEIKALELMLDAPRMKQEIEAQSERLSTKLSDTMSRALSGT